jgi:mannose-1-phosphate guanylyltransferase/mannose-6-phosphate isomerase
MTLQSVEITPIILCGGFGSRLWPLSREDLPKQFLKLGQPLSLFQNTVARMQGGREGQFKFAKPIIATGAEHRFLVAEQLREMNVAADIILEPVRRDSAAAILSAAAISEVQARRGLIMVVASDHAIPDVSAFHDHVAMALRGADTNIVLFGIQPMEASGDYGYISPGSEIPDAAPVHRVSKFAEKPTPKVAGIYVASGYLWNSGNFICRADVLLREARILAPEIAMPAIAAAEGASSGPDFITLEPARFSAAKPLSIDFAVLEKSSICAVLPSNFVWSDLGTWKSIHAMLAQDGDGNAASGQAQFTHAHGSLVLSEGPLVAVEGLSNVVVTVTPDAILVAALDTSVNMKPLVERVKASHPSLLKKPKA